MSRDEINEVLQAHFRPEFLNRIDEIVIFHPLRREDLAEIVDIQLRRVKELLARRGFKLEITPEAREFLAETGYDPDYGARPLKRAIQRELQDPLALAILSGEFNEGDTIRVERVRMGWILWRFLSIIRNGVKWGARVGRLDAFCYPQVRGYFCARLYVACQGGGRDAERRGGSHAGVGTREGKP